MSFFKEIPKRPELGPPLTGELAKVQLLVDVVFEWSNTIIVDCDYDENGNMIDGTQEYGEGYIMVVIPNQRFVYHGEQRIPIAMTWKEKES